MKQLFTITIFALAFYSSKAQINAEQYYVGVPVYDTLFIEHFDFVMGCEPDFNATFIISHELVPLATGLELQLVVSNLNATGAYTQSGTLNEGDVFTFASANSEYEFHFPQGGSADFMYRVTGTPTTEGENYFCTLEVDIPSPLSCGSEITLQPSNPTPTCTITSPNGINQLDANKVVGCYPNPFTNYATLEFRYAPKNAALEIYDIYGKQWRHIEHIKSSSIKIQRENLNKGLYFYELREQNKLLFSGKLMVN